MIKIIKKNGNLEEFQEDKIVKAVNKSADRINVVLNKKHHQTIILLIKGVIKDDGVKKITVDKMHKLVENALIMVEPAVAQSYMNYRNYKKDFVQMLDKVFQKSNEIQYLGDKDNANSDSSLIPTQRSLIFGVLSDELYKKTFLNKEELEAMNDGYIYIHDRNSRLFSVNCCLFDVGTILRDGFEMANMHYTEPKTLDVAFDVISDIVMSASACQYGE